MARMPGAQWRPLPNPSKSRMSAYDIICIHTMVGSLAGTDGYFRRLTNGVNSHFGTGGDGMIYQWVDTAVRSGANGNGNHRVLSIENEDIGPLFPKWNTADGGAVPAFTPAQIEANAQIIAWACRTHGIPCELIPDAKPGRRGIGYHRQGVPGFMVAGAEQWSSARGKVCPGARRIAQIPQIIARAQAILGGAIYPSSEDAMTPQQWNDLVGERVDKTLIPLVQQIKAAVDLLIKVAGRPLEAEERLSAQLAEVGNRVAAGVSPVQVDAAAAGKAGAVAALNELGQVLTRNAD